MDTLASTEYTLEEVAKHKSRSSCWIVINGLVYDVTTWLDDHPGGDAVILGESGRDASRAFSDIGHSAAAIAKSRSFVIGKIKSSPYGSSSASSGADSEARSAFQMYDLDGDGSIDASELQSLAYGMGEVLSDDQVADAIRQIDLDGDKKIQFDEFLAWWKQPRSGAGGSVDQQLRMRLLARHGLQVVSAGINRADELRRSLGDSGGSGDASGATSAGPMGDATIKLRFGLGHVPDVPPCGLRLSFVDSSVSHFGLVVRIPWKASTSSSERDGFVGMISGLIMFMPDNPKIPKPTLSSEDGAFMIRMAPPGNEIRELKQIAMLLDALTGVKFSVDVGLTHTLTDTSPVGPLGASISLQITAPKEVLTRAKDLAGAAPPRDRAKIVALCNSAINLDHAKFDFQLRDVSAIAKQYKLPVQDFTGVRQMLQALAQQFAPQIPPPFLKIYEQAHNVLDPIEFVELQLGTKGLRLSLHNLALLSLLPDPQQLMAASGAPGGGGGARGGRGGSHDDDY